MSYRCEKILCFNVLIYNQGNAMWTVIGKLESLCILEIILRYIIFDILI